MGGEGGEAAGKRKRGGLDVGEANGEVGKKLTDPSKKTEKAAAALQEGEEVECEDPYGDDFEEEIVLQPDSDDEAANEADDDGAEKGENQRTRVGDGDSGSDWVDEDDDEDDKDDDEDDKDDDENDKDDDEDDKDDDENDVGRVNVSDAKGRGSDGGTAADEGDGKKKSKANQKTQRQANTKVWRPGVDQIADGEELDYDSSAYDMLHRGSLEWSCLSFDIVPDDLGSMRCKFPHTAYVVTGTQADRGEKSKVFVMKWSRLHKTKGDGEESGSEDEDEDDNDAKDADDNDNDEDAVLDYRFFFHDGTVNRIRCCPQAKELVATWSEKGKVHVWNIGDHLGRLDVVGKPPSVRLAPRFTHHGHSDEGYAMAWNPHQTGVLVTGDCSGEIHIWEPTEGGWSVGKKKVKDHSQSVEDLGWQLVGDGIGSVFASSSSDKSLRVFDIRDGLPKPQVQFPLAHDSDINVLSWNPVQGTLIVTGDDEGCCKVWDLRHPELPLVKLHWHKKPITSVDWHPSDEAVFASSCSDNSTSIWDLSVEYDDNNDDDDDARAMEKEAADFPAQLMFHHLGQDQPAELKWHPQIPGVLITTACDGFNIFKAGNV